jgi:hypothetical protein
MASAAPTSNSLLSSVSLIFQIVGGSMVVNLTVAGRTVYFPARGFVMLYYLSFFVKATDSVATGIIGL